MRAFPLKSDCVSLEVTEVGGQLSDVNFRLPDGRRVRPMHVAPWLGERLPPDVPPVIQLLRGDFFCAPFGDSDVIVDMPHVHGPPANGLWHKSGDTPLELTAVLGETVLGATVFKHVAVTPGEAVVYQRHTLAGGSGRLPIGHHSMLRGDRGLRLGFSPWIAALTPPRLHETPPLGRQLLLNNQVISDIHQAGCMDGTAADLSCFPCPDGYESLWMLVANQAPTFGWTAATCAREGWVWFSLKNPRVLPQTLVWLSNGGRNQSPWDGRHRNAVGLEEICGYFHLGHAASIRDNPVSESGIPTAATLRSDRTVIVSYLFGLAPVPPGFGVVTRISAVDGGVEVEDDMGLRTFAACDPSFVS